MVPRFTYFDFIPMSLRDTSDESSIVAADVIQHVGDFEEEPVVSVGLTELEVGSEYEIVLKTYGGEYKLINYL